ncbi:hypothetical protein J7438_10255 [Thalassotalea sp. G20_0]|uniref:hypothetical protein n=1 Tax=Thalassotalea sp. G20_0 TaxID=2821093 RepID=UPI001ADCB4EE|nr:hypothetical protein [Thalassotalea sp. G20_0]MBO9494466.1 hypothetical protein [Thalassotalea sp. G20_0]
MSVSYLSVCQALKHHCTVCLDSVDPFNFPGEKELTNSFLEKYVFVLDKCKHLMHLDCFRKWQDHCRDLSERDPSLPLVTCCPTCKTEVKKEPENKRVLSSFAFDCCEKAETRDPKPSLLETPVKITPQILDTVRPFMDEAVSTNNFPAMWQLKSRYNITLSAAQLKEVLWQSLPQSFHVYVTPFVNNKIRMALDLMTHDEASKWVVCDFLKEVFEKDGQLETTVKILLDSKMLSESALKATLNYFISRGKFHDARIMKEQYGVSINSPKLKQELTKAYKSGAGRCVLERILSLYDKDDKPCIVTLRDILKIAAMQPEDYSPELLGQNRSKFFDKYMEFINTLLSHGVEEQTAVDAAMSKAVSTLRSQGLKWAGELKTKYGAKMDPAKLRVAMDKAVDKENLFLLELIAPLFTNGKDADEANIMSLEKLASKPNQYFGGYRDAKETLTEQLERIGNWSQHAVNTLIKKAVEGSDFFWADELHRKYNAHIDPEVFKNHILKEANFVKKHGHKRPDSLAKLFSPLPFIKPDNPGLLNAIQEVVGQICGMEYFPLQQFIVSNLMDLKDKIHSS